MRYRRAFVEGGSFFFTLVTEKRQPIFASAEAVEVLRSAFRSVLATRPFALDAIVVLPDHLHCIWTLPPGDADFATRWRLVKTWFTKHCDPALRFMPNPSQARRREQTLWQHRYWEHMLRDERDFERHVEYVHYNPVKHGYVDSPMAWPLPVFGGMSRPGYMRRAGGGGRWILRGLGTSRWVSGYAALTRPTLLRFH